VRHIDDSFTRLRIVVSHNSGHRHRVFYHLHELHRAALTPFRLAAEANQFFLRHPFNPLSLTHGGRAVAAMCELFETTTRPYEKPAWGLKTTTVAGKRTRVRQRVVAEKPFCDLVRFEREGDEDGALGQPRLLLVAPLSGHFATLLRGTVKALIPDHDVYVTDWRDAKLVPKREGQFDLDDYIDYVIDFLHVLGEGTHVMAVCQPSVPVLAAVAFMSKVGDPMVPRTMTLMGGPIDTRENPTVPNDLATGRSLDWFENTLTHRVPPMYPGAMRRVYPGFLQLLGFVSMNLHRHVGAHMQQFHHLVRGDGDSAAAHRRFYDEYLAVMDLPAEYYLQTVKRVFQEHQLAVGTFHHREELIDPAEITKCALMTVEGEKDDISGVGQTRAAQILCSSLTDAMREHYEQPGVGHYGVFNGRRWRDEIAPRVKSFIARHDEPA
jgi:poly(3-hydroxybutyrate) depolymerase